MKRIITILAAATLSLTIAAQDFKTGYFLDNYVYAYRLNPALSPDSSSECIASFLLGDISVAPSSSIGMSQLLFPIDGKLYWGFNEKVPAETFLGGLPDYTKADVGLEMDILTVGVRTKHGFITFDTRLRSNTSARLSNEIYGYLKDGIEAVEGAKYNLQELSLDTKNYLEFAVSYSRRIGDIKVGATLKGLAGIASVNAQLSDIEATFTTDEDIQLKGTSQFSYAAPLLSIPTRDGQYDFSNIGYGNVGLAGAGAAMDLGIHWEGQEEGLSVDAAVVDLGFIKWGNSIHGSETFTGKQVNVGEDADANTIINTVFGLDSGTETYRSAEMLAATFNAGIRYKMPFYKNLSVGAHGSYTIGNFSNFDLRLGATVTPHRVFSFAADYGFTSYGSVIGVAANFRLGPFALFAGVDDLITRFNPQCIPIDPVNTTVKFGITIAPKHKERGQKTD